VVATWIGDCLWTGKPSRYMTNHQDKLILSSLQGRYIEYRPLWLGLRWGAFTCVGWQVTLCDSIWQIALWWVSYKELYRHILRQAKNCKSVVHSWARRLFPRMSKSQAYPMSTTLVVNFTTEFYVQLDVSC